jgi:hypothetical protein
MISLLVDSLAPPIPDCVKIGLCSQKVDRRLYSYPVIRSRVQGSRARRDERSIDLFPDTLDEYKTSWHVYFRAGNLCCRTGNRDLVLEHGNWRGFLSAVNYPYHHGICGDVCVCSWIDRDGISTTTEN